MNVSLETRAEIEALVADKVRTELNRRMYEDEEEAQRAKAIKREFWNGFSCAVFWAVVVAAVTGFIVAVALGGLLTS